VLDAFRRGEAAALERVFLHYSPRVAAWVTGGFGYKTKTSARRFAGFRSAADIHDAIHETFRAAFEQRSRDAYSGLVAYEGYLFAITKNVVLRKLGKSEPVVDGEELDELASVEPSPEDLVAREEENQRVREYLATLSEEERGFVTLRFSEQMSQHAVAEKLGWGRKKVRLLEESIRSGLTRFLKRNRGSAEVKEVLHDDAR
jgi:RNA polymerase sigma-70 factor (ECF subfamily)